MDPAVRLRAIAAGLACAVACGLGLGAVGARASFRLGLEDDFAPANGALVTRVVGATRSSVAQIFVPWSAVAPARTRPAGFNASDPADPHYAWGAVDAQVRGAAAHGQRIMLRLSGAPAWAEGPRRPKDPDVLPGAWDPDPVEFAAFARAAARRYGGRFADPANPGRRLPRAVYWEAWNEQNLPFYFDSPSPFTDFRTLANAFYSAVKGVDRRNVVVLGGMAPVSFLGHSTGPLRFAAGVLCLRRIGTRFVRTRRCAHKARFDVLAHHPYSLAATPTKHAYNYDDVLIADMPKLRTLLRTAERLHTVAGPRRHGLWVTEFGLATNPPNRVVGDTPAVAARYTALAQYLLWRAGVTLVVWFNWVDDARDSFPGSGLYTRGRVAKPMLRAFSFPLYAQVRRGHGYVWGRAPVAGRRRVRVERLLGRRWSLVAQATTRSDGVFQARFRATRNRTFRARVPGGRTSLGYWSAPVPPRRTHAFARPS